MTEQKDRKRKSSKSGFVGLLVALAILLGWCGHGFFGGEGKPGQESAEEEHVATERAAPDAAPAHCSLRVDASGIKLQGKPADEATVIAACKPSGEAELTITGDAKFGVAEDLRAALEAAGIRVSSRGKAPHATSP